MEGMISSTTRGEDDLIDVDWFNDDFSTWLAQYEQLEQTEKKIGKEYDDVMNVDGSSSNSIRTDKLTDQGLNKEQLVQEMKLPTVAW